MDKANGFFLIELMIGFLMLHMIIIVATGYVSYQMRMYQLCTERLRMLSLADQILEAHWGTQTRPEATTIDGYTLEFQPIALPRLSPIVYGLITVKNADASKKLALPIGCMELVWA